MNESEDSDAEKPNDEEEKSELTDKLLPPIVTEEPVLLSNYRPPTETEIDEEMQFANPNPETRTVSRKRSCQFLLPIRFRETEIMAVLDSGSRLNVVSNQFLKRYQIAESSVHVTKYRVAMVDDSPANIQGEIALRVIIDGRPLVVKAIVVPQFANLILIGRDTMFEADIDLLLSSKLIRAGASFFDIDSHNEVKFPMNARVAAETTLDRLCQETVVFVCPRKEGTFLIKKHPYNEDDNLVIPAQIVLVTNQRFKAVVENTSHVQRILSENEILVNLWPSVIPTDRCHELKELADCELEEIIMLCDDKNDEETLFPETNSETEFEKLISDSVAHLDDEKKQLMMKLLKKYVDIISKHKFDLGLLNNYEYEIETGQAAPIHQRAYRMSPVETETLQAIVDGMLKHELIEPSYGPWASATVLVSKPDGSSRMCADYRQLNAITKKNRWPIPRIDDILDKLKKAVIKWFTSMCRLES